MSTGNVTPRPWEVKDGHLVIESGLMTPVADCALNDYGEPDTPDRWKANAEYIVRAANAHVALIKAIQFLMNCVEMEVDNPTWREAMGTAREVLALAKYGGES